MTLLDIAIGFNNVEEQAYAEDFLAGEYSIFASCSEEGEWTEFDVSGCEPDDISRMLKDLMDNMPEDLGND